MKIVSEKWSEENQIRQKKWNMFMQLESYSHFILSYLQNNYSSWSFSGNKKLKEGSSIQISQIPFCIDEVELFRQSVDRSLLAHKSVQSLHEHHNTMIILGSWLGLWLRRGSAVEVEWSELNEVEETYKRNQKPTTSAKHSSVRFVCSSFFSV